MKVAFIGAGKVGRSFGFYLNTSGFNVVGYYSRTKESAELAARETGSLPLTKEHVIKKADLIFITTPDSQIEKTCNFFAQEVGFDKSHTVVHMSGGLSCEALKSAREQGASVFSLHPLQSFARVEKAREDLNKTFFALEGVGDKDKIVKLLKGLKNPYVEIDSEKKPLYHGAATIASNYLVALSSIVLRLLEDCGFNRKDALIVAGNLMRGTLDNIRRYDTVDALTGPIARGDVDTVLRHLHVLETSGYKRTLDIYRLMGEETVEIAHDKGLSDEKADQLKEILKIHERSFYNE